MVRGIIIIMIINGPIATRGEGRKNKRWRHGDKKLKKEKRKTTRGKGIEGALFTFQRGEAPPLYKRFLKLGRELRVFSKKKNNLPRGTKLIKRMKIWLTHEKKKERKIVWDRNRERERGRKFPSFLLAWDCRNTAQLAECCTVINNKRVVCLSVKEEREREPQLICL